METKALIDVAQLCEGGRERFGNVAPQDAHGTFDHVSVAQGLLDEYPFARSRVVQRAMLVAAAARLVLEIERIDRSEHKEDQL